MNLSFSDSVQHLSFTFILFLVIPLWFQMLHFLFYATLSSLSSLTASGCKKNVLVNVSEIWKWYCYLTIEQWKINVYLEKSLTVGLEFARFQTGAWLVMRGDPISHRVKASEGSGEWTCSKSGLMRGTLSMLFESFPVLHNVLSGLLQFH